MWQAFIVSTGVVAMGEIGDKTQLLALLLAARFRRPVPIILGILVATLANHAMASALGAWITRHVDPQWLRWGLGASFLAVAAWMLIPDKADELKTGRAGRFGAVGIFGITALAFFLAEMGDKTQIATVGLAAKYASLTAVVAGTTLGMMLANAPAVFIGHRLAEKLPVRPVHIVAALIFAVLGVLTLTNGDALL